MANNKSTIKCPKCDGEMDEGLIADKTTDLSMHYKPKWTTKIRGFNLLGGGLESPREVKTFRCKKCCYLESYAK